MSNEVAVKEQTDISVAVDYEKVAVDYLRSMGMKLPQKYEHQFIEICKAYNLNPIKREIYAVGYGENWNIITGYEVYLKRASRLGDLDGWECTVSGDSLANLTAKLTIHRKSWKYPFVHEVYYTEAVGKKKDGSVNAMWTKMPRFMLKKVCIAQGFRLCFPDEFGGMPYTNDEIVNDEDVDSQLKSANIEEPAPNQRLMDEARLEKVRSEMSPRNRLEDLIRRFKAQLEGEPLKLALDVISNNSSDSDIENMYNRCTTYLGRKGIKVA